MKEKETAEAQRRRGFLCRVRVPYYSAVCLPEVDPPLAEEQPELKQNHPLRHSRLDRESRKGELDVEIFVSL